MNQDTLNTAIDITGLIIAIAGFLVVIVQLFKLDKSLKSSARGSIYDMASRIKEVFLTKPHLRQYFFEGQPLAQDSEHYHEAIAVADYFCLYLEQITTEKKNIDKAERATWIKYVHDTYQDSPILIEFLKGKETWYSPKFWEVIEGKF